VAVFMLVRTHHTLVMAMVYSCIFVTQITK